MIVTFDFDITLKLLDGKPNKEIVNALIQHLENKDFVFIVTSRNFSVQSYREIENFLKTYVDNIDIIQIFHTNMKLKIDKLTELGSDLHYDDDPEELIACEKNGIKTVNSFNAVAKQNFDEWMDSL